MRVRAAAGARAPATFLAACGGGSSGGPTQGAAQTSRAARRRADPIGLCPARRTSRQGRCALVPDDRRPRQARGTAGGTHVDRARPRGGAVPAHIGAPESIEVPDGCTGATATSTWTPTRRASTSCTRRSTSRGRSGCSRARRRLEGRCRAGDFSSSRRRSRRPSARRRPVGHASVGSAPSRDPERRASRRTGRCCATRSPTACASTCRSSSRSRRRPSAPAAPAAPWSTSSTACGRARKQGLRSSTSRSTRATTRRRASTAGCAVEPADRAVDVPGRPRRADQGEVRGRAVGRRAAARP